MNRLPATGETWTHYKGGIYKIIGMVWGAEGDSLIVRVLYSADELTIFSRPIADFLAPVGEGARFTWTSAAGS